MESLPLLMSWLKAGVTLMLVLTVLIAVHELGHYLLARAMGMHVEAFAVMVGGVRRTDLQKHLKEPLAPAWIPWLTYLGFSLAAVYFGTQNQLVPTLFCLVVLAVTIPIWVMLRLSKLYHYPVAITMSTLIRAYLVGIVVALIGRQFQGLDALTILGVCTAAAMVAMLSVYYRPISARNDEEAMGAGEITTTTGERVEISYRPLVSKTDKNGTEFSFLLLPLGGFARMRGMHAKEDGSETKISGGFYNKSPFARLLVLAAGPIFSIALGVLLLTTAYSSFGIQEPSKKAIIGAMVEDSPAKKAGLKPNDEIVSVNGVATPTFFSVVKVVRDLPGKEVDLVYRRGGKEFSTKITPIADEKPTNVLNENMEFTGQVKRQGKLRIAPAFERRTMGFSEAFATAVGEPKRMLLVLGNILSSFDSVQANVGGVGSMAVTSHAVSESGFEAILNFAAMLSISVGIFNLLPIPPLDGGQMVVAFIELFRGGKRLSYKLQQSVMTTGFVLVTLFMMFAISQDIGRFGGR